MVWDEDCAIAHGPQALRDALKQLAMVTLRKVCAAYAARKQHVTHKSALDVGRVKHHMARRVARAVAYLQHMRTHLDLVTVVHLARGREALRLWKTKHAALLRQAIDPKLVSRVGAHNGQPQALGKLPRAARMVDVRMGKPICSSFKPKRVTSASTRSKFPPGSITAACKLASSHISEQF